MATRYLVTGATGGLGSSVLATLLKLLPAPQIIAGSSRAGKSTLSTLNGTVELRHVDFGNEEGMTRAFKDIDILFFVSAPIMDTETRINAHKNVVSAVKASKVKHVYYSSLAFGGTGDCEVQLMEAHLTTERLLKESGITFTSIREGVYADAFPLFLNWYPSDPNQELRLPHSAAEGKWALASREELGEATAKLMVKGGFDNEIVLFSGPEALTLAELVEAVNEASGRNVSIKWVSDDEYIKYNFANDEGKKPEFFFHSWTTMFNGVAGGDAAHVSPLLQETLGRRPLDARQFVKDTLRKNRDYTWHQNYFKGL